MDSFQIMRRLSLIFLLFALIQTGSQATNAFALAAPGTAEWYTGLEGYNRAISAHRESRAPLVVYFYVDWCGYCRHLDNKMLPSDEVQSFLKRVVKVRINPEAGDEEERLAELYGVTGYPSFFVIAKPSEAPVKVHPFRAVDGEPVALPPAQFALRCRQVARLAPEPFRAQGVVESYRRLGGSVERSVGKVDGSLSKPRSGRPGNRNTVGTPRERSTANADSPDIDASGPMPSVDQIIEKYIEVVGGRDVITKFSSRAAKGTIDIPGVSRGGTFELYAKAPNKALTTMNVHPLGLITQGFNGSSGWYQTDRTGLRSLKGVELDAVGRDSDFYSPLRMKANYPKMRLMGRTKFGYREAYVIAASPAAGLPDKFYFDTLSGLPIRLDTVRPGAAGQVSMQVYLDDWRDVDGIKLPFRITQSLSGSSLVFEFLEIKHAVTLDDHIFNKPATR